MYVGDEHNETHRKKVIQCYFEMVGLHKSRTRKHSFAQDRDAVPPVLGSMCRAGLTHCQTLNERFEVEP